MKYPEISFIEISGYKTIMLTYTDEETAMSEYKMFEYVEYDSYKDIDEGIIISFQRSFGSELRIKLLYPITSYKNGHWLLKEELTHVTTSWEHSESYNIPLRPFQHRS